MREHMEVGIFNGTIATTNGLYRVSDISIEDAKKLLMENSFISAIGHKSTAEVISYSLGMDIPMNRIEFKQKVDKRQ